MAHRVGLVHGLWMRAPMLAYWARGLRKAGYDPVFFTYRSLTQSPETAMRRLRDLVMQQPESHVLAHSLGGLLAVKALAGCKGYSGRIVCVGTPLAGSRVVRRYSGTPLARLAGSSAELLSTGLDAIPEGLSVSVIAGTEPFGLGRIFHRFRERNDGTVAFSETEIPGLRRHVAVAASHSGQLVSSSVLEAAVALLSDTPR
jgi:pimeloyl-ACP methyl ester carboxylesterase